MKAVKPSVERILAVLRRNISLQDLEEKFSLEIILKVYLMSCCLKASCTDTDLLIESLPVIRNSTDNTL